MASAQTEPSMDEILASIRRIISEEDDAPEVPVRQKLETLHLAEDADGAEGAEGEETVREQAEGGEPAAQLREVAREESQPDEAKKPTLREVGPEAEATAPKPDEPASEEPTGEEDEGAKGEAADDLDDFDPLPEEPATGGSTMEPAADAHDHGEVRDETFDETPEAVHEASEAPGEAASEPEAPKPNGVIRQVAEAVRPAVAALGVGSASARQAADAFGALEENVRISAGNGRTMEDLVEAMLAPMLTAWLDENLPRIVEDKVEEEVRRIARRR